MTAITCTSAILADTIRILQAGGERREERVVLWLAPMAHEGATRVVEVYEPGQVADFDYFRLPPESMRTLMAYLRAGRLRLVAQVHSHPGYAYHSEADDSWAIVRQLGGLSLVLPRFARTTTPLNFTEQAMTYELTPENRWTQVPSQGPLARLEVVG
ncbi:Mov34/MPN/PAD-1 family protein [Methylobacterium sp. E-005]|uniref:Mov34/MPN/PAD-1 family protein n=1 Tax=Methylobacterium sp. E-005 TaxID=2836549 RepID=UPI001FBB725D|nr:Mov34/MPN/PAD-1 family protein [Methylobacterium sp. E-005]MCJ2086726.1 Mov34/MPN/PAD-1 family protein [Methylobacterium sp. E-005]